MSDSVVWRGRWKEASEHLAGVVSLSLVYVASELVIWGLSLALASAKLQYCASVLGMVLIFSAMTVACQSFRRCDSLYRRWVRDRVDFINAQLGMGFSVPIIMLDHIPSVREIGCIVATSVVTNIFSWVGVFLVSLAGLILLSAFQSHVFSCVRRHCSTETPVSSQREEKERNISGSSGPYQSQWKYLTSDDSVTTADVGSSSSKNQVAETTTAGLMPSLVTHDKTIWYLLKNHGYLFTCVIGIVTVGIPLKATLSEDRVLDGFALWLSWIIAVRLQRIVKQGSFLIASVRLRHTLATMLNPVLVTTTFMLGYTRLQGVLSRSRSVTDVLDKFSSGTPLYSLWTAVATSSPIPGNTSFWFGAGDFALSLLECGIVSWGFKLYECRHQLFSIPGLAIFFFCSIAAAGNVFLSVLFASKLGLNEPEALAFGARSTTLALAKPAVKALGGNLAKANKNQERGAAADTAMTVAAGTTIGINGAAMGVSYLYEVKSRAAPYAALSMTIFGVMTVAFTTLEPFKGIVLELSS